LAAAVAVKKALSEGPYLPFGQYDSSEAMLSHACLHVAKKCEALGLCSLGHVKPFLGDIYNSEL
jgi:hypothetical protein